MSINTPEELARMRAAGAVVRRVIEAMKAQLRAGVTTAELDKVGADVMREHGAQSAPSLVYGFPGANCISINEEAAHGIPSERVIRAGDVLNVDVSAELGGYFADTGGTKVVPPTNPVKTRLCHAARTALEQAMKQARDGQPLNGIGAAIQRTAKTYGFKIIENLGSHGVGRALHEEPEHIPGYFNPNDKRMLKAGMVITIEPFLSTKSRVVKETADGWTLVGMQGNLSAQYEHTMIITKGEPIVVTRH